MSFRLLNTTEGRRSNLAFSIKKEQGFFDFTQNDSILLRRKQEGLKPLFIIN